MPELIDRLSLIDKLDQGQKKALDAKDFTSFYALVFFKTMLQNEPLRHGRWIFVGEETMHDGWTYRKHKCTECDYVTVEAKNFCNNCGARMDLRTPTEVQLDEADSVMMGGADNG